MKFTDFEVTRVGDHVVLSCFTDTPPPGQKVQVTIDCTGDNTGLMYEQLFIRLTQCAVAYEEVPDDVLEATIKLMKGSKP